MGYRESKDISFANKANFQSTIRNWLCTPARTLKAILEARGVEHVEPFEEAMAYFSEADQSIFSAPNDALIMLNELCGLNQRAEPRKEVYEHDV